MQIEILIVETHGSAPRRAGTRMWVSATQTRGSIGGGNLEHSALKIAREMLASGETRRQARLALGEDPGESCGGGVTLSFEKKEGAETPEEQTFDVVLFGAGHVGKEVARILERLPCRLTWVDPRPEQFPQEVAANVRLLVVEEPAAMIDAAPPGALYLVMTHSHALDLEIVERILRRKDYGFLGLIGSRTKAAKFRAHLEARGLDASGLTCPLGLFKSGRHPAEVAVSAVAQLLSVSAAH